MLVSEPMRSLKLCECKFRHTIDCVANPTPKSRSKSIPDPADSERVVSAVVLDDDASFELKLRPAVFAAASGFDVAAERMRDPLHAVTNAQDGNALR